MKVESLKTSPDRAGRYWVTFDDGSKMGLYRQTVEEEKAAQAEENQPEEKPEEKPNAPVEESEENT